MKFSHQVNHIMQMRKVLPLSSHQFCLVVWSVGWLLAPTASSNFTVYWNVPTYLCNSYGIYFSVTRYGIQQNEADKFYGDKVAILYNPGAFPYLDRSGPRNGGIPQLANFTMHHKVFMSEVQRYIPSSFRGVAVLDFESYYPSYGLSPEEYQWASEIYVHALHPDWDKDHIVQEAMASFNSSAKKLFLDLLMEGHRMRPGALWGYYHYPYCSNSPPNITRCRESVKKYNDAMMWLFESSAALYPSIYLFKEGLKSWQQRLLVKTRLTEAIRVRSQLRQHIPILPYFWFRYHNVDEYLNKTDVVSSLGEAALLKLEGAVIWGSSSDVSSWEKCSKLQNYVESFLGPFIQHLKRLPFHHLHRLIERTHLQRRPAPGNY